MASLPSKTPKLMDVVGQPLQNERMDSRRNKCVPSKITMKKRHLVNPFVSGCRRRKRRVTSNSSRVSSTSVSVFEKRVSKLPSNEVTLHGHGLIVNES
ncbi:hypothetical protein TNCV_2509821 [Trichonephila clavipes]|nr:hypothetical protein TNCV_2509821 [Trichonephila clavipes]